MVKSGFSSENHRIADRLFHKAMREARNMSMIDLGTALVICATLAYLRDSPGAHLDLEEVA